MYSVEYAKLSKNLLVMLVNLKQTPCLLQRKQIECAGFDVMQKLKNHKYSVKFNDFAEQLPHGTFFFEAVRQTLYCAVCEKIC